MKASKAGLQCDCVDECDPARPSAQVCQDSAGIRVDTILYGDMLLVQECLFRRDPVFTFIHVLCRVVLVHAHMSRPRRALGLEAQRVLRWSLFCFYA